MLSLSSLRNIATKERMSEFSSFKKSLVTFTDGVLLVSHLGLEILLELVCRNKASILCLQLIEYMITYYDYYY